jgi:signal transduction histidine kinase/ligand-binding sensor domain-containing protein
LIKAARLGFSYHSRNRFYGFGAENLITPALIFQHSFTHQRHPQVFQAQAAAWPPGVKLMKSRIQFLPVLFIIFTVSLADLPFPVRGFLSGSNTSGHSSSLSAVVLPQAQTLPPAVEARFERITTEDGLSHNNVNSILQDSQGFMWFGTIDGLNRYDGYSFTVYRHEQDNPNSLREDFIVSLYEDRAGILWVGTRGGWLEKYDRQTEQFTHYKVSDIPRSSVLAMLEDHLDAFWIQVCYSWDSSADLLQFDRKKEEISSPLMQKTTAMFEGSSGVLWVGTQDGQLNFYDRQNRRFEPYLNTPVEGVYNGVYIRTVYEDSAGALWIGSEDGGLRCIDRQSADPPSEMIGEVTYFQHDSTDPNSLAGQSISAIVEDQSGGLWIGFKDHFGLDRYDVESGYFTHYQDEGNLERLYDSIQSLYVDHSGMLWVGTTVGLIKLDLVGCNFQPIKHIPGEPNSLGGNDVSAIHQDHTGVIWVGTANGLDRFDRQSGSWRHYRNDPDDPGSLSNNRIWSIYEDRSGALWVGTPAGLDRYDSDNDTFIHIVEDSYLYELYRDVDIRSIYEDRTGKFWIASHAGLFQLHREVNLFLKHLVGGVNRKVALYEDSSGVLWVGTAGDGLQRVDGYQYKTYRANPDEPESLSSNFVNAILEDQSGALWVGTAVGLDCFDRQAETFTHYTESDGLPATEVLGILEDEAGNLWLSTAGGLSKFDPRSETFRNYDVSDGLQSDPFNQGAYFKSSSGEMFFGGLNGFNAFKPEQITGSVHIPPILITKVNLFDQTLRTNPLDGEQIELSYQENTLSFEFAVLDYVAPEKNQYATMLEGFDADWDYIGTEHFAEYRNLKPGDYVFRVKGANSNGTWNEMGSALHITIKPPFWETWWFRGAIALTLVGVAFGAYRLRVRGIEMRSYELEKQVQERTAELSETNLLLEQEIEVRKAAEEQLATQRAEAAVLEERSRLARDLHDSVTQSLYSLTLYADAAQRLLSTQQLDGVAENLGKAGATAKEALGEMRSLVYELLPPILEQEGLVAALEARLEAVEGRAGLETHLDVEGYDRLPAEIEAGLYGVAQEALNNALKHAHASRVSVKLHQEGGAVVLEIVDDGVGFDPQAAQAHGGMGLRGMAERVAQMGGQLEIQSAPGEGTSVQVTVDLQSDS